ncbi:MAG: hap [Rhodospirillales bacterium]|jgi:protease YdgD|nr:hap [Rhodospirillales bacterium]
MKAATTCLLLIGLALAAALTDRPAAAKDLPPVLLPGIGAHDPRQRIDPTTAPWRSIGKVQANSGNLHMSCTGSLVGATTVLTAAHCVYNPKTGRNFPPESLHFLIGYDSGNYAGHAVARAVVTGPGYDPREPRRTMGSDWALLTLDKNLGTPDRILTIRATPTETGTIVTTGGYSQDHPLLLTVDPECRIIGLAEDSSGKKLLHDNCTGTHGASGAPILLREGGVWQIVAMRVAAEMGVASGVAALLDEARKRL